MSECQGNCLKYLERGWKRKEERGHKDFKKRWQARSRGGCLKKGGGVAGTSLRTMIYIYINIYIYIYVYIFNCSKKYNQTIPSLEWR